MINKNNEKGLTLIELMVTVFIASLMLIAVFQMFIAQKELYVSTGITSEAQNNARIALDTIQRDLMKAGFGIDPATAFPFFNFDTLTAIELDAINGPDTLQFFAREQSPLPGALEDGCPVHLPGAAEADVSRHFYWKIATAVPIGGDTGALKISVCKNFELRKGTFLLAMCYGGGTYAFMRYQDQTITAGMAGDKDIAVKILYFVRNKEYPPTFLDSNVLADTCFQGGTAGLFRVNFYRYYVCDSAVDAANCGNIPYLMLDTGMDLTGESTVDIKDHIPVAEGIEDMQIAYALFNGNVFGGAGGTQATSNYFSLIAPAYCDGVYEDTTCRAGSTTSARPQDLYGNTVGIRISLVARSDSPDPAGGLNARPALENHPAGATQDKFRRVVLQTTIPIVNTLTTRSFFFFNLVGL
ncbi:MAG TPA: PilW family protein [bacterium]